MSPLNLSDRKKPIHGHFRIGFMKLNQGPTIITETTAPATLWLGSSIKVKTSPLQLSKLGRTAVTSFSWLELSKM